MRIKTKCSMGNLCAIRKGDGECEKNCYYNTREVKTNADRIRGMSDEELADHFSLWCCRSKTDDSYCKSFGTCDKCWFDWLKEEVHEIL